MNIIHYIHAVIYNNLASQYKKENDEVSHFHQILQPSSVETLLLGVSLEVLPFFQINQMETSTQLHSKSTLLA